MVKKSIAIGMIMLLFGIGASSGVMANEKAICESGFGQYLTGIVVKPPSFSHGQFKKGVELSHTHLNLKADQDGRVYDVAIDNVFASGYIKNNPVIPAPLNTIQVQDRLELCGQLYTNGVGIHWVHTNCGDTPDAAHPNGWIKKIDGNQHVSNNLENNTQFCNLWPRHRFGRMHQRTPRY